MIETVTNRAGEACRIGDARKIVWPDFIRAQSGRWKREADACIERYGLTVFGDKWVAA